MALIETKPKRGRPKGSKSAARWIRAKAKVPPLAEDLGPEATDAGVGTTDAGSDDGTQPAEEMPLKKPWTKPYKPAYNKAHVTGPLETPTFYQRMNAISKEDWGTRAFIYMYRLEPFVDRTIQGLPKYITRYAETVSEEKVLEDHGSGKYKAVLNYRKPAAERGDELDSIIFEIHDQKYPPKIPPIGAEMRTPGDADWLDFPHNRKWAWVRNHLPKPLSSAHGGSSLLADLEVLDRIQNRNGQQKDASEQLATVVTVAKDLAALQKPPESPAAMVLEYMKLAGQASSAQLTAAQAEIASSRERGDKLMMMLIDREKKADNTNGFDAVQKILSGIKEFLPSIKEILPDAVVPNGRTRMTGWQEFTAAIAPHAMEVLKPFSQILAQVVFLNMQRNAPTNGVQPQPAPPATQAPAVQFPAVSGPPPSQGQNMFLAMIAEPMLNYVRDMAPPENLDPGEMGEEFAEWVHQGYSADPRYEPALGSIKMLGPQGVAATLKTTPLWADKGPGGIRPSIAELENQFLVFMDAFLNWKPLPERQPEQQTEPDSDGIVHFEELYEQG